MSWIWVTGEEGGTGVCSEHCHLEEAGEWGFWDWEEARGIGEMTWGPRRQSRQPAACSGPGGYANKVLDPADVA